MSPWPFLRRVLTVAAFLSQVAAAPSSVGILYLREIRPPKDYPSIIESTPADSAIAGAQLGLQEINLTGGFVGLSYGMEVANVTDAPTLDAAMASHATSAGLIVADLSPSLLLHLADSHAASNAVIFDIANSDDRLRQQDCRANIFHILPSNAMRMDALAQFLITKNWQRWFVVHGPDKKSDALRDIRLAADKFGGRIVDDEEYDYNPGARRLDTGFQQIQTQMPEATHTTASYDVLIAIDPDDLFGDYLPYNTFDPRPIAGTQGLVPLAWHPAYQEYSALQMQRRFQLYAHRRMEEPDYAGWLALRAFGEAVLRSHKTQASALRNYLRSRQYEVAGFKGAPLTFRPWDQQLRQPVLLAAPLMVVTLSPQEGFLHQDYTTDSLGIDEPESQCHLN
jgi:ABC transporter substrate binding protein (PQQ-dependent alcohol dehydrogenase system)